MRQAGRARRRRRRRREGHEERMCNDVAGAPRSGNVRVIAGRSRGVGLGPRRGLCKTGRKGCAQGRQGVCREGRGNTGAAGAGRRRRRPCPGSPGTARTPPSSTAGLQKEWNRGAEEPCEKETQSVESTTGRARPEGLPSPPQLPLPATRSPRAPPAASPGPPRKRPLLLHTSRPARHPGPQKRAGMLQARSQKGAGGAAGPRAAGGCSKEG